MGAVVDAYRDAFAAHKPLAERARGTLPGGITSDSRQLEPFPLTIESARGARKWDRQGREFIDLWCGHGSLLFGHAAPEMVEAASAQLQRGTHVGACHRSTTAWAEQIIDAVASAQRVRFTGSGTEAVLLALALARASTGRTKVLRFEGHYHGWSDWPTEVITCPHELDAVCTALRNDPDIAAVILEPTGPCSGVLPLSAPFVQSLRELTHEHGSLLVFDEIVTGFRAARGGAQARLRVEPDLTTLAKITCGGLPGGAVTGRAELLALLDKRHAPPQGRPLPHLGTFSGNPVSAAAGIATLQRIANEPPYDALEVSGQALRDALNRVFDTQRLDWLAYGEGSCIKLLVGHGQSGLRAQGLDPLELGARVLLARGRAETWHQLRLALLLHGVDMSLSSFVSTAHTSRDIDEIALAFDQAVDALRRDGQLP